MNLGLVKGSDGAQQVIATPMDDGRWVSERIARIVEAISDYDPAIEVQWIPPDKRGANDPAFRIVENTPDGTQFVMFYVSTEDAFDEGVLARIWSTDVTRNPLSLEALDAHNKAVKAVQMKERLEEMEEAHDLAAHIWRSPKSRYKHDGFTYE